MSAIPSPRCSQPTLMSPRMPPTSSRSTSRSCRRCSTPAARSATFEPGRSTEAAVIEKAYGDLDGAFRSAHAVVEITVEIGRHSGVPLETRGAVARYDAARDVLELHGAAKVPHWNRDAIARMLGRAPSSVHLYEGHVGGGFGIRGELYPEDVLVCLAAMRLGVPVKWIEDRREHLIAANHSRQQVHRLRAAVDAQGQRARARRRVLPRPGRLCPHPCGDGARSRGVDAAGPLSPAGLSCRRPHPPHQQDAGRHLSRAGPLRDHVRARAHDGCHRRAPAPRPHRGAPPQPDRHVRDALCAAVRDAGRRHRARFRRLCGAARQGPAGRGLDEPAGRPAAAPRRRRSGRRRACAVRGEERPRPIRRRAGRRRSLRRGRGRHRRGLGRAGRRDRDGANLRRCARRRLCPRARHPWPDRPHRFRHGRIRFAGDRDDGIGDTHCRRRGAREGARGRRRNAAAAGRSTRHRRRQCRDRKVVPPVRR